MRPTILVLTVLLSAVVALDLSGGFFCHGFALSTSSIHSGVVSFQPYRQSLNGRQKSSTYPLPSSSSTSPTALGLKFFGYDSDSDNNHNEKGANNKNNPNQMIYPSVDLSSLLAKRIGQYSIDDEKEVQEDIDKQLAYLDKEIAFVEASSIAFDNINIDDPQFGDLHIVAAKMLQEIYEARRLSKVIPRDGGTKDLAPKPFEIPRNAQQYFKEKEEGDIKKIPPKTKISGKTTERKTTKPFWNMFGGNGATSKKEMEEQLAEVPKKAKNEPKTKTSEPTMPASGPSLAGFAEKNKNQNSSASTFGGPHGGIPGKKIDEPEKNSEGPTPTGMPFKGQLGGVPRKTESGPKTEPSKKVTMPFSGPLGGIPGKKDEPKSVGTNPFGGPNNGVPGKKLDEPSKDQERSTPTPGMPFGGPDPGRNTREVPKTEPSKKPTMPFGGPLGGIPGKKDEPKSVGTNPFGGPNNGVPGKKLDAPSKDQERSTPTPGMPFGGPVSAIPGKNEKEGSKSEAPLEPTMPFGGPVGGIPEKKDEPKSVGTNPFGGPYNGVPGKKIDKPSIHKDTKGPPTPGMPFGGPVSTVPGKSTEESKIVSSKPTIPFSRPPGKISAKTKESTKIPENKAAKQFWNTFGGRSSKSSPSSSEETKKQVGEDHGMKKEERKSEPLKPAMPFSGPVSDISGKSKKELKSSASLFGAPNSGIQEKHADALENDPKLPPNPGMSFRGQPTKEPNHDESVKSKVQAHSPYGVSLGGVQGKIENTRKVENSKNLSSHPHMPFGGPSGGISSNTGKVKNNKVPEENISRHKMGSGEPLGGTPAQKEASHFDGSSMVTTARDKKLAKYMEATREKPIHVTNIVGVSKEKRKYTPEEEEVLLLKSQEAEAINAELERQLEEMDKRIAELSKKIQDTK